MIRVSLPIDTPLALPGGVWEQQGIGKWAKWVKVEEKRWWYEDGRIRADYTKYEAKMVVGMMERER